MRRFAYPLLAPLAAVLLAAQLSAAGAAQIEPYTPTHFATAQAEGKPVIVHVVASWCSTCAAQIPIVQALLAAPKYKELTVLTVDFDSQKALLRQFDVRAQSTFVAFKGRTEVGRSTGETSQAAIASLFDKAS